MMWHNSARIPNFFQPLTVCIHWAPCFLRSCVPPSCHVIEAKLFVLPLFYHETYNFILVCCCWCHFQWIFVVFFYTRQNVITDEILPLARIQMAKNAQHRNELLYIIHHFSHNTLETFTKFSNEFAMWNYKCYPKEDAASDHNSG